MLFRFILAACIGSCAFFLIRQTYLKSRIQGQSADARRGQFLSSLFLTIGLLCMAVLQLVDNQSMVFFVGAVMTLSLLGYAIRGSDSSSQTRVPMVAMICGVVTTTLSTDKSLHLLQFMGSAVQRVLAVLMPIIAVISFLTFAYYMTIVRKRDSDIKQADGKA